jgi:bla regulator protein blaR1
MACSPVRPFRSTFQLLALLVLGASPATTRAGVTTSMHDAGPANAIAYVHVHGDTRILSAGEADAREVRALGGRFGKEFLWVRRDGRRGVIRDPRLLAALVDAEAPMTELGEAQSQLGNEQAELGEAQSKVGELQSQLGEKQARLGKMMSRPSSDGAAMSAFSDEMRMLGEEQGRLGHQQARIGEQQRSLGQRQGDLGRRQAEATREFERQLVKLVDSAEARGLLEKP